MIPNVPLAGRLSQGRRSGLRTGLVAERLFAPVDASFLACFRIAFGALMVWETWRILQNGWVERHFSGKEFYFTYWPLDFVQPWPGDGMYVHLALMGVFAAFIALGFLYRVSAACFFLMFAYVFLLEKARYLNHLYLVCLLSALLAVLPAHRCWSVDALLRPRLRPATVPAWTLWLLRFQVAVPMFFAGLAKLNPDWLRGEPLRMWLAARPDFPVLGPYFQDSAVVWGMVYGALLIDLLFFGYMTNRRTRVFGFGLAVVFHLLNARLFSIGIFPWLMIAATPVFFGPDWPRRIWDDVVSRRRDDRLAVAVLGLLAGGAAGALVPEPAHLMTVLAGAVGGGVFAYHLDEPFGKRPPTRPPSLDGPRGNGSGDGGVPGAGWTTRRRWVIALLGLWVAAQVIVPLRHYAIAGNVHWTEEGRDFSWHMKLRDKDSNAYFVVTGPAGRAPEIVQPSQHLTDWQVTKMASRPELVLQFAHYLERLAEQRGKGDVAVYAHVFSSLNGRPHQRLVDDRVDLTRVGRPWLGHASWILPILPLAMPLPSEAGTGERAGERQVSTPTRTLPP